MLSLKKRALLTISILSLFQSSCFAGLNQTEVHIVLFAGQSNMAGAGNYHALNDTDKAQGATAAKQVHLTYNGKPATPLSYFSYTSEKYDFDDRFGPELFVGIELAKTHPQQEYLFIKRAQGGTALYGAWNPAWSAEKAKAVEKSVNKQNMQLVKEHREIIYREIARLKAEGKRYKIIGMCWMQGENDAAKEVSARSYEANLQNLIAYYRTEFNLPNMPFVYGQINSRYGKFDEGPSMVRQAMLNVAEADANATVITTTANPPWDDYPKHSDQVHYNEAGQKRLGVAFAKALIELN